MLYRPWVTRSSSRRGFRYSAARKIAKVEEEASRANEGGEARGRKNGPERRGKQSKDVNDAEERLKAKVRGRQTTFDITYEQPRRNYVMHPAGFPCL